MTTPPPDISAIAEKLSEYQRKAVLSLSKYPQDRSITFSVRLGYALERMGLAARTLLTDETYLTPFGLAVRAYLLSKEQDNG